MAIGPTMLHRLSYIEGTVRKETNSRAAFKCRLQGAALGNLWQRPVSCTVTQSLTTLDFTGLHWPQ
jgi:hypothetical protein